MKTYEKIIVFWPHRTSLANWEVILRRLGSKQMGGYGDKFPLGGSKNLTDQFARLVPSYAQFWRGHLVGQSIVLEK